jgi:hypothetical protein
MTDQETCGCKVHRERIPRSNGGTREVWEFCTAHEAEYKIHHNAALAGYRVSEAERALRREFT